jgi:hypothetical protein
MMMVMMMESRHRMRVAVCYLCLDAGLVEPLRRDCACRGTDAGFVHFSCLTKYAASKSELARDVYEFRGPWKDCPSCHQNYQNELAVDIASEFVSFVRRKYPHDTQRQVESLHLKLRALILMIDRLQPVQKIEAGVTANVMLSLIDRLKGEVSPLPRRKLWFESYAYNAQGLIALEEGTEESARRAEAYFKKDLKVSKAIGNDDGIANAKRNIVVAMSKYKGGGNDEEFLKVSREMYKLRISELGEEHYFTIDAGKLYAICLQKANRREEARELLMKLLATSKQVFGSDHNTTKEVGLVLNKC